MTARVRLVGTHTYYTVLHGSQQGLMVHWAETWRRMSSDGLAM